MTTLLALLAAILPLFAAPAAPLDHRVTARLISETPSLTPGSTATLGVYFKIEKGWHIYWDGANDTGQPPSLKFTLPRNFKAGEIQWPAPARMVLPGDILDHVYEGEVTLLVPLQVPADAPTGSKVTISVDADWLVCHDICLPEEQTLEITLPIAAAGAAPAAPTADQKLFDAARSRLPKAIPAGQDAPVSASWNDRRLEIRAPGAAHLAFFPTRDAPQSTDLIKDGEAKGDALNIRFRTTQMAAGKTRIGVVEVRKAGAEGPQYYWLNSPSPGKAGEGSHGK